MSVKAKEVKVRAYDSFFCSMCGGKLGGVHHYRLQGQCYFCLKCSKHENVKSVLTREYRNELSHLPTIQRAKFLDMMQRDVVRFFQRQQREGVRAGEDRQSEMDLQ